MSQTGSRTNEAPAAALLIVALIPDLMTSMRVEAAGQALGYAVRTVTGVDELRAVLSEATPAAVVIDLAAAEAPLQETLLALTTTGAAAPPTLGFFPHVLSELGRAAREAGCTVVVPRSRFMSDLPGCLRAAVGAAPAATEPAGGEKR